MRMQLNKRIFFILLGFTLLLNFAACKQKEEAKKPNIIIILADDMGISDLGCYGGEINTPNLDKLADSGLRYRQFYNTSRCCPTRASLLTGLYAHQTGLGWMTRVDMQEPGYRGQINHECVTLAEALKPAGYSTYMSGKWHVVLDSDCEPQGPKDNWPLHRGFDKYYGILKGASDYFNPTNLYEGDKHIEADNNFYLTDAVTEHACEYVNEHAASRKNPFFMYVAYTAPHWPLQAKNEDIKKYEGKYAKGWDKIREERYQRMKTLGIIGDNALLSVKTEGIKNWNSLSGEEKANQEKRMAVYAAQIDNMDQGIGRIIETLKKNGLYENTVIMFLSDNGGCMQPISRGNSKKTEDIGTPKSFESYGESWANVSNTPFRLYKKWEHEGGIISPLIVHWPRGIKNRGDEGFRDQVAHVIDLMPTVLELSGAEYPSNYKGNKIIPYEGISLVATFNDTAKVGRTLFWEHLANRGVREDNWKLVSIGTKKAPYTGPWELYDLDKDASETNNLAEKYPQKVKELSDKWYAWAKRCNVLPVSAAGWNDRIKKFSKKE